MREKLLRLFPFMLWPLGETDPRMDAEVIDAGVEDAEVEDAGVKDASDARLNEHDDPTLPPFRQLLLASCWHRFDSLS